MSGLFRHHRDTGAFTGAFLATSALFFTLLTVLVLILGVFLPRAG
jgi:hypothetical protein